MKITKAYTLSDNHLDSESRVELSPVVYHLHSFFPNAAFAASIKQDNRGTKVLADICKTLAARKESEEKDTLAATRGMGIIQEGQQARRREVTAKARKAMVEKMAMRGQKRKLTLS